MNQLNTFFKTVNKICLEPLGKEVLHFQSPKAYKYFVDCKDNLEAWQPMESWKFYYMVLYSNH